MYVLFRPLRLFAKALSAESAPRQLALGFAMGMVIGLVPKGNLIAVALMTVLCASKVNLGIGMLAAFLFSWAGLVIDPWTHRVGEALLSHEKLFPVWTKLYNTPVVPWTDFNNSIVLGSFVVGLVLLYPVYRITLPAFERIAPTVSERLKKYRVVRILWGAEWADKLGSV